MTRVRACCQQPGLIQGIRGLARAWLAALALLLALTGCGLLPQPAATPAPTTAEEQGARRQPQGRRAERQATREARREATREARQAGEPAPTPRVALAPTPGVAPTPGAAAPQPSVQRATSADRREALGVLYVPSRFVQTLGALDQATRAGIRWVRIGIVRNQVHKAPGDFDFSPSDHLVEQINQNGAKILAVLGYSTTWDTTGPARLKPAERTRYFPPEDLTYWREYVRETARRYKGKIAAYEIWNEPDPGSGSNGIKAGTPAQYAALVAAASEEIRAQDPQALVVGGAFHGRAILRAAWIRDFWFDPTHPPAQALDVFSFHLIGPRQTHQRTLDDAAQIVQTLRQDWQVEKPLWLTEVGYSSHPAFQEAPYLDAPGQAQWIQDTLPPLLALGIDKLFWALLQDEANGYTADGPFGRNGLFDRDQQPKPAYNALLSTA